MKHSRMILLLLSPLLLAWNAFSQVGDWNAVRNLSPDTKIHVTLKRGRTFGHCFFDRADEEELVCTHRAGLYSRRAGYRRGNIKTVYLTHNGVAIGIGIGAGTGAVIGATRSTCCHVAWAVIGAGGFALLGGFVGLIADPFFHGHAVYRSPLTTQALTSAPVVKQDPYIDQPEKKIPCLRDGLTMRCVTVRGASSSSGEMKPETTTPDR
ncbi:MAG: hypothetical protein HY010_10545 [Acidobacteria bacterium]|nr:hypothetical protein [Acidobacteriota bacterium]